MFHNTCYNIQLIHLNIKTIFLLAFLFFSLSSCVGSSVTSFAGNAAISAKGVEETLNDTIIFTKIKAKLLSLKIKNLTDISVHVSQGRVLLIGITKNSEDRLKIVKNIWEINGVNEIYNEIIINDEYSLKERSKDLLITTKVNTYFLFKSNIFSNNYSVEVFKGDLYIIGIAVSLEEKSTIENYLLNIKDVNKVINFIFLAKGVKYMRNE